MREIMGVGTSVQRNSVSWLGQGYQSSACNYLQSSVKQFPESTKPLVK